MSTSDLRSRISIVFKMHGLTLKRDAGKYLDDVLSALTAVNQRQLNELDLSEPNVLRHETMKQDSWMEKIIDAVLKQPLNSTMITKEHVKKAATECLENYNKTTKDTSIFSVIDAFSMPKYTYNANRKKFIANSVLGMPSPCIYPDAKSKALLYQERFTIIHQMVSRHELFTPPVFGLSDEEAAKKFQLYPIEYLLGTTNKMKDLVVLGMLSHIEEGKYHLEDPTGAMVINLSGVKYHAGIFTENCFVLAEGSYDEGVFWATSVGLPPIESASATRSYFGNLSFCGIEDFKTSKKLANIEKQDKDAMMIILAEIWLDQVTVMHKLRSLFSGYASFPPVCFIFIGNFISNPHKASNKKLVQECFRQLGDLIAEFPTLVDKSSFVFVPGPADLGLKEILPRPAIPPSITSTLRQKVPKAIFTSNPTRLQYCTQEIVVFREDLLSKVSRHCLHFPSDEDTRHHLVKTILSQAHLCPVPIHAQPIYWEHDHALKLYPLPELIIFADDVDSYAMPMAGTQVANPGSFSKSDYIFKVYLPADKLIEDSQIVPEEEQQ